MTSQPVRVVLADDHPATQIGVRHILESDPLIRVVGEARTGTEALAFCLDLEPDVIVLEINLPEMSGIEVAQRLKGTGVRVLPFSACSSRESVAGALAAGAAGFLTKDQDTQEFTEAVHAVAAGKARWLVHLDLASSPPQTDALTEREGHILSLLARGLSNQAIAESLFVSESTVRNALTGIYSKLDVQSCREASAWAWAHGFVKDPDV